MAEQLLALRIDDIGASSKQYEIYSNKWHGLGNLLFLKYIPSIRAWGPYREMTPGDWDAVFGILERHGAKLTAAITACWVEHDGRLTPFPEKYPEAAKKIKEGAASQLLEVANHGLTHCLVEGGRFRPRLFSSNRKYHREFWEWIPDELHDEHIKRSQKILQDYFETEVVTFVPPGNVYSTATVRACSENGIRTINCSTNPKQMHGINIIGQEQVIAFHDRDLILEGVGWLEKTLLGVPQDTRYVFLRDL